MTSKSPTTLEQDTRSTSKDTAQATVTGVDSAGQLFRDGARIVFLKARKCIYLSKYRPSPDGSLMIETRGGKEAWRSNAKVRSVSPAGPAQDSFRVTVELDRAHDMVIETAEETAAPATESETASSSPSAVVASSPGAKSVGKASTAPARKDSSAPEFDLAAIDNPITPAPAPAPYTPAPSSAAKTMVAEAVRSIMASELEQLKKALQSAVAIQAAAAIKQPLEIIEAKIEQGLQKTPAINEQSVRKIAAQAAENAQVEWATTSQKIVAEAVHSAVTLEGEQQRRELRVLVSAEIEAALRGPLSARIDAKVEKAVEAKVEEHSRKHPSMTEGTVRQIAGQVAESIQLEWASTKLQTMIAEVVRSTAASESVQRRAETTVMVSDEIEAAIRGPLSAQMDEAIEKQLTAKIEQYFRTPSATGALHKLIAEAVRQPLEAEYEQRGRQVRAAISSEIETAVRGPIASQMDEMLEAAIRGPLSARMDDAIEKQLTATIEQHFRTPSAVSALQKLIAEAVRQPLEAEYEQRGRQVQAAVSSEIETAVRGPIASQMDEMLRKALETQRAEYLRTPPPVTDETIQLITVSIAQHPQLQNSIDALAVNLSDRWAEIARGATANAQQDINSRIAATERLANQVVLDIQQKLNSFNLEMNRILGTQESASASEDGSQSANQPEREGRFRELLQSTGSNFEREMKAALQRIFGKS